MGNMNLADAVAALMAERDALAERVEELESKVAHWQVYGIELEHGTQAPEAHKMALKAASRARPPHVLSEEEDGYGE